MCVCLLCVLSGSRVHTSIFFFFLAGFGERVSSMTMRFKKTVTQQKKPKADKNPFCAHRVQYTEALQDRSQLLLVFVWRFGFHEGIQNVVLIFYRNQVRKKTKFEGGQQTRVRLCHSKLRKQRSVSSEVGFRNRYGTVRVLVRLGSSLSCPDHWVKPVRRVWFLQQQRFDGKNRRINSRHGAGSWNQFRN